jgi:uncharacterized Tic20 family protein
MSQEYPTGPARGADQSRTWSMLSHLGGILTYFFIGWVVSLVVFLVERERGTGAREQARVALNFQLTLLIGMVAFKILNAFPVIGVLGWIGMLAVGLIGLVLSIVAAVAVSQSGSYRYPFSLELVR